MGYEKDYSEINLAFYKKPKPNSDWEKTWKVTESLIKLMRDEVSEKKADFMVITASDSHQVLPDIQRRDGFRKSLNVSNLFYPDIRLKNFGKKENIPVYNLAGPIWNEAGHKFVGEIMANYLCEKYTNLLKK